MRAAQIGARVDALVRTAAATWGGQRCILDGKRSISFGELDDAADAWARALRMAGIETGDRIVVPMGDGTDTLGLLFGAIRSGAVAVPLASTATSRQREALVRDCDPAVVVDRSDIEGFIRSRPATRRTSRRGPADVALLMYTSGSTGMPRGVICPHAAVVFVVGAMLSVLRYEDGDIVYCALPLHFDYGLYQVLLALCAGSTLVLAKPGTSFRDYGQIRDSRATVVPVVPSLARRLAAVGERSTRETGVRLITNTGEALTSSDRDRLRVAFPQTVIISMFGLTECKRVTIGGPDEDLEAPTGVGRALPGTQIWIRGDDGQVLPPGAIGELVVEGPHVMAGYWRAEEETNLRFGTAVDGTPRLFSGDYGTLDSVGRFHFVGRRDGLFKVAGIRTSALEIERAAAECHGVREVAFLPPDGTDDEPTLAIVGDVASELVLREIAATLGPERTPARCLRVDALPLTPNGKVERHALRALAKGRAATP